MTSLFPFCAALFAAGFAARSYGAFHFGDIPAYIAGTLMIYASPYVPMIPQGNLRGQGLTYLSYSPILELANYHILGRLMYYVPYCAPLHPGRVLTTFGTLSFLVEVLNGIGIAWLTRPGAKEEITRIGDSLTKASLLLQLGVITLFCFLAALFQRRCNRAGVGGRSQVVKPLVTLYVSMALILIRTIYRVVDHFSVDALQRTVGAGRYPMKLSPVIRYEWFFYVFEATVMLINMYLWNTLHPMGSLPSNYHVYLAKDGHTELEGPGWKDNRSFILTWMDPLGLFIKGDDKETPFWESNANKWPTNRSNLA